MVRSLLEVSHFTYARRVMYPEALTVIKYGVTDGFVTDSKWKAPDPPACALPRLSPTTIEAFATGWPVTVSAILPSTEKAIFGAEGVDAGEEEDEEPELDVMLDDGVIGVPPPHATHVSTSRQGRPRATHEIIPFELELVYTFHFLEACPCDLHDGR